MTQLTALTFFFLFLPLRLPSLPSSPLTDSLVPCRRRRQIPTSRFTPFPTFSTNGPSSFLGRTGHHSPPVTFIIPRTSRGDWARQSSSSLPANLDKRAKDLATHPQRLLPLPYGSLPSPTLRGSAKGPLPRLYESTRCTK